MSQAHYSEKELEYMCNQDFLLTKNVVIQKTFQLLTMVQTRLQSDFERQAVPSWFNKKTPKISKGEQYQGLPYLMLDYPRIFEHDDVFAFRTLFWWGNYFSSTLHLSGKYLELYRQQLVDNSHLIKQLDFYFCVSEDPWQHHYKTDYYQPAKQLNGDQLLESLQQRHFIKISKYWSLDEYDQLPELVSVTWENLMRILDRTK